MRWLATRATSALVNPPSGVPLGTILRSSAWLRSYALGTTMWPKSRLPGVLLQSGHITEGRAAPLRLAYSDIRKSRTSGFALYGFLGSTSQDLLTFSNASSLSLMSETTYL